MTKNEWCELVHVRPAANHRLVRVRASRRFHLTTWSPSWVEEGVAKPTP